MKYYQLCVIVFSSRGPNETIISRGGNHYSPGQGLWTTGDLNDNQQIGTLSVPINTSLSESSQREAYQVPDCHHTALISGKSERQ